MVMVEEGKEGDFRRWCFVQRESKPHDNLAKRIKKK